MAIIFNTKSDYRKYALAASPDKLRNKDEKEIATQIFAKINPLKEKAVLLGAITLL